MLITGATCHTSAKLLPPLRATSTFLLFLDLHGRCSLNHQSIRLQASYKATLQWLHSTLAWVLPVGLGLFHIQIRFFPGYSDRHTNLQALEASWPAAFKHGLFKMEILDEVALSTGTDEMTLPNTTKQEGVASANMLLRASP